MRKKCKACSRMFDTTSRDRQYCASCDPDSVDAVDQVKAYKELMARMFELKLDIQKMENLQAVNKDRIIKLGQIIQKSPEMREVKQLTIENRSLGQKIADSTMKLMNNIRIDKK